MARERLDAVDGQARRELARQDEVVTDRRSDIDKIGVGRQPPNEVNENFFLFRFVDVAVSIARALFFEKLIFIDADAIIESVNRARHLE
jgi:hypothetical protein